MAHPLLVLVGLVTLCRDSCTFAWEGLGHINISSVLYGVSAGLLMATSLNMAQLTISWDRWVGRHCLDKSSWVFLFDRLFLRDVIGHVWGVRGMGGVRGARECLSSCPFCPNYLKCFPFKVPSSLLMYMSKVSAQYRCCCYIGAAHWKLRG